MRNESPRPQAVQPVASRVLSALEHFLHVESTSGIVLLAAAAAALIWANLAPAHYHDLWHAPLSVGFGRLLLSRPLHFWIDDVLMCVFFLVAGLEIRREIYDGVLADVRTAVLPIVAALGGVVFPALIYLAVNSEPELRMAWAVPTATDIAFAVGVLALLGNSVPAAWRVLLLSLAVIDDILAVLVIALFYSEGIAVSGLAIAAAGVLLVLVWQRIGLRSAFHYLLPGAIVWFGFWRAGIHPTLAGVVLGLLTPAVGLRTQKRSVDMAAQALHDIGAQAQAERADVRQLAPTLRRFKQAQRELLPPVIRVQTALHPWVAYGVMPLFALANAGVELGGASASGAASQSVALGILIALVAGKPLGVAFATGCAVRLGWCTLPASIGWRGIAVSGCLAGIGFTMSIFIATLAFHEQHLLEAAKLGVLTGSFTAATAGLLLGRILLRRSRSLPNADGPRAALPLGSQDRGE